MTRETQMERSVSDAVQRGLKGNCPNCGSGRIFGRFLKVNEHCPTCGEALHHHRADDAPPYVVISIVGHIIIGLLIAVEVRFHPAIWLHLALWVPLTIALSLLLLQPVKGALVGLQWALRMHGFGAEDDHVRKTMWTVEPTP